MSRLSALQEDVGFDIAAPPSGTEVALDAGLAVKLVRELDPRQRLVILAWAVGAGESRIAKALALSPSRVSQRRHAALRHLRAVLGAGLNACTGERRSREQAAVAFAVVPGGNRNEENATSRPSDSRLVAKSRLY